MYKEMVYFPVGSGKSVSYFYGIGRKIVEEGCCVQIFERQDECKGSAKSNTKMAQERKMTAEVVTYMTLDQTGIKRMQFEFVAQCAAFLKGMRTASVLNIEKKWVGELCRLLESTDISFRVLVVRKDRCLAFVYRKEGLKKVLSERKVRQFLLEYGYGDGGVDWDIACLSVRMNRYSKEEIAFPHEIGVFLDYPLEDVKAFIENHGKKSLMTGYWKVYHNPARAGLMFLAYDKARDSAVNEFLAGKTVSEIAKKALSLF